MRMFVGIPVSDHLQIYYDEVRIKMTPYVTHGSFYPIKLLHMTLLFLGELTKEQVENLHERLRDNLIDVSGFFLHFNRLGTFKKGNAHVLFIGMDKVEHFLLNLVDLIKRVAKEEHLHVEDSPYIPHITLGRGMVFSNQAIIETAMTKAISFPVERIHLYQSERVDGVLCYTPRHTYRLKR